jgi:PhnB protein
MRAIPYLFFGGTCTEAVEFYRDSLGAEISTLIRFRDLPGAGADTGDRVMHAELKLGESTLFASDGQGEGRGDGRGYAISLIAMNDDEAERLFLTVAEGGRIDVPLMSTPFASRFGMATDRFGTPWMVTMPQPAAG